MNFDSFKWLNESKMTLSGDKITIEAPPLSDFFNNPVAENGKFKAPIKNAPFYYTEVEGDFVIKVKVKPNFKDIYDAACIMVIQDEYLWFKAAYEKSDFGTNAVVSVVTNKVSDDANGCNLDVDECWLQVARVGDAFAVHYSVDGKRFDMVRVFTLPVNKTVKVGIEAQCPVGKDGGSREFSGLSIERRSIGDMRKGL